MERTVVVTGASSGLGLAFLTHYAAQPATRVIALDISPLAASISSLDNVVFYGVDVTSEESLKTVSQDLNGQPIHMCKRPPTIPYHPHILHTYSPPLK
jgi:NAD(P)-dependent dehydrogenase (short-subunit alcohol dehydrogenase family)